MYDRQIRMVYNAVSNGMPMAVAIREVAYGSQIPTGALAREMQRHARRVMEAKKAKAKYQSTLPKYVNGR